MTTSGKTCPYLGKKCIESKCAMWQQVMGKNPQTGAPISEWDCVIVWQMVLTIENSQINRQTGAAVESLRNRETEGLGLVANALRVFAPNAQQRLPEREINGESS